MARLSALPEKIIGAVFVAAFLFALPAFASDESASGAGSVKTIHMSRIERESGIPTYKDPSKAIQTVTGEFFIINLESNRTTGYEWQLAGMSDKKALELVGVEYVHGSSQMPGAPGSENWTFKALGFRKEDVGLSFIYVRPWEKDVEPAKEVKFRVRIGKGSAELRLEGMQKELDKMRNESWDTRQGR